MLNKFRARNTQSGSPLCAAITQRRFYVGQPLVIENEKGVK